MTENQAGQLFTATVEFRRPGAQQWEVSAQATDTLDGLVDWAAAWKSSSRVSVRCNGAPDVEVIVRL